MTTPGSSNRKARRAAAAQRRKTHEGRTHLPISSQELEKIGASAAQTAQTLMARELGIPAGYSGAVYCIDEDPRGEPRLGNLATAGTVFIPFIAAKNLRDRGIPCRVVVGGAIWSVGPGDRDTLDHGVQARFGPERDAAAGNYHTWLEIAGHLVDLAARLLPLKFDEAARIAPFSTPRAHWRRFPKSIVHSAGVAMPNPKHDREAAYGYWEGAPSLRRAVERRILPVLCGSNGGASAT